MSTHADISVEDGVAHVALNAGSSLRLTKDVLKQVQEALTFAAGNDDVALIVLSARGGFPTGLTDPCAGGDDEGNTLSETCNTLENCAKPVISVLSGTVMAGGVELALACHYRLARSDTRIGFPQVRLGLMPQAGATQRLPRLVGAGPALDLLLGGQLAPLPAGFADETFEDGPYEAILGFVEKLRQNGVRPRPTSQVRVGFEDMAAFQSAIANGKSKADASGDTVTKEIVAAVEASLILPIEAGLAFEETAYEDCRDDPSSAALTHVFSTEQATNARNRRLAGRPVSTLAVMGGGPFAASLVLPALDAGLKVHWLIRDPNQQRDSIGYIQAKLKDAVLKGQISSEKARQCQAALTHSDNAELLTGADIALRAARGQRGITVPSDLPVAHCLPGTDTRLAMRFGRSTPQGRMVEITLGPEGANADLSAAMHLAKRMNLIAIVQRTGGMCLSDRLNAAMWQAADALVDVGQSPYSIDAAMRGWGMEVPPYQAADQLGLGTAARHTRADRAQNWAGILAQSGREGAGSKRGFYRYAEKTVPQQDPDVLAAINALRPAEEPLQADEIVHLIIGAMANVATQALRENVVEHASDIDLVSIYAGILPRRSGGVFHSANTLGLLRLTNAMKSFDHPDQALWTPDPIFAELIKNGHSFADL